jgi:hypothetical protein
LSAGKTWEIDVFKAGKMMLQEAKSPPRAYVVSVRPSIAKPLGTQSLTRFAEFTLSLATGSG